MFDLLFFLLQSSDTDESSRCKHLGLDSNTPGFNALDEIIAYRKLIGTGDETSLLEIHHRSHIFLGGEADDFPFFRHH